MPKKTKKEKLLARYHKKLHLLENRQVINPPVQTKIPTTISTLPVDNEIKTVTIKPLNQYFFFDLKKSLILIIFILSLEIILYFTKLIK